MRLPSTISYGALTTRGPASRWRSGSHRCHRSGGSITWSSTETMGRVSTRLMSELERRVRATRDEETRTANARRRVGAQEHKGVGDLVRLHPPARSRL